MVASPVIVLTSLLIGGIGLVILVLTLRWLRRATDQRKIRLRARKSLQAVSTETPVDNPNDDARKRGLASIEGHFTVTRRVLVPLILVLTGVGASIPFLDKVPAATLSVLVACVAGLLGLAARPLLENGMAGLVLSFSRHVNIGDTVKVHGWYGVIEDIGPTHTAIRIWDWRRYVLPNSEMLRAPYLNYSAVDRFQWADVEFHVSPDADLEQVRALALAVPRESSAFAGHEAPRFWVLDLGPHATRCRVAAWADSPQECWQLEHDIRYFLSARIRDAGILTHVHRVSNARDALAGGILGSREENP